MSGSKFRNAPSPGGNGAPMDGCITRPSAKRPVRGGSTNSPGGSARVAPRRNVSAADVKPTRNVTRTVTVVVTKLVTFTKGQGQGQGQGQKKERKTMPRRARIVVAPL